MHDMTVMLFSRRTGADASLLPRILLLLLSGVVSIRGQRSNGVKAGYYEENDLGRSDNTILNFGNGDGDGFVVDFEPSNLPNMNGEYPYTIGKAWKDNGGDSSIAKNNAINEEDPEEEPPATETRTETRTKALPKHYRDYPGGVEMFEVLSPPMTTLYSQVWWAPLAPVNLPSHIIKKYDGKSMAIVGWEIDQVRRRRVPTINQTNSDTDDDTDSNSEEEQQQKNEDLSVPISASYNHHYVAYIIGKDVRFEKVKFGEGNYDHNENNNEKAIKQQIRDQMSGCGHEMPFVDGVDYYVLKGPNVSPRTNQQPTYHQFSSANGGEYRKTFHGFPPPFVLVIDSPTQIQITPMQIDTWNRDKMDIFNNSNNHNHKQPTKFVPGPLPRSSLASQTNPLHSGLLECPMTTRLTKVVDTSNYTYCHKLLMMSAPAPQQEVDEVKDDDDDERKIIQTSYECFEAAATLVGQGGGGDATTSSSTTRTKKTIVKNETVQDPNLPTGCSVVVDSNNNDQEISVFFNELTSGTPPCGGTPSTSTSTAKTSSARCVCSENTTPFGTAKGALLYHPTNQTVDVGKGKAAYFDNKCERNSNLLQMKNPTCDIRYYEGGQWACSHLWSLLDADQEIPWADQPLVFHHKYRFWVQPYKEEYHKKVVLGEHLGDALLIGSPWEYDIPKCTDGIPGCSKSDNYENDRTWIHTINGTAMGRNTFVTLNNHCHAPTCLSVSVYACSKDTNLNDCNDSVGHLICETKPIYGGTGHPSMTGTKFDEPGYIAIPDCIWGSSKYGLAPPIDLEGAPLFIVKKSNATEGHYGEMSGGQPWVTLDSENEDGRNENTAMSSKNLRMKRH